MLVEDPGYMPFPKNFGARPTFITPIFELFNTI